MQGRDSNRKHFVLYMLQNAFFLSKKCQKICRYQKKAVPLQSN